MSDIRGKDSTGYWKDVRLSDNGDLLLVTGKLVNATTTKALAATTDYAAEDVLADAGATAWRFRNVVSVEQGSGVIVQAQALLTTTALTPRVTLYLFEATPTATLTDNAANTALLAADLINRVGRIDFLAMEDLGTGMSESVITTSTYGNLPVYFTLESGRDLYGIAVTRDAITGEAAGMKLTFKLSILQM